MTRSPKRVYVPIPPEVEKVGKAILDAAFKVHTALGPGLLEAVYETTLTYEIQKGGWLVETQVAMPIVYDNTKLESGLRLDMLVEKCAIDYLSAPEQCPARLPHQLQCAPSKRKHQTDVRLTPLNLRVLSV